MVQGKWPPACVLSVAWQNAKMISTSATFAREHEYKRRATAEKPLRLDRWHWSKSGSGTFAASHA
jgi:hypothetical protein